MQAIDLLQIVQTGKYQQNYENYSLDKDKDNLNNIEKNNVLLGSITY